MTDKIHGKPIKGFWGERDITWLRVDVTTVDLLSEPWAVNGNVDAVIKALETRGTILGFYPDAEANNVLHICFGHAAGYFGPVGSPLIVGDPAAVPPIADIPEVPGATAVASEAVAPAVTEAVLTGGATKALGELAVAIQDLAGGFLEDVTLTVGHGFKVATYPAT